MRRAVEGRLTVLRVLIFETGFTFVTLTTGLVEVLRVRVLRVFVGVAAVDLTGIGIDSDVYSIIIHEKRTPWGSYVTVCGLV
tara:strand:- start:617 stop:862 length:246 start_codon:yes stop_codon:yes gene_type:complete